MIDDFLVKRDGPSMALYLGREIDVVFAPEIAIFDNWGVMASPLRSVSFGVGSQLREIANCPGFVGLVSIRLPPSLLVIGEDAFRRCCALSQVSFEAPSQLHRIKSRAFRDCGLLSEITLPSSLTVIEEEAFYACKALRVVTFEPGAPPAEMHPNAFAKCDRLDWRLSGMTPPT
jgi:hypothetical protein